MAIDAVIDRISKTNKNDLILHLRKRDPKTVAGQDELIILNPTHTPKSGQEIWGGSDNCIIEPGHGVSEQKKYVRIGFTRLREDK